MNWFLVIVVAAALGLAVAFCNGDETVPPALIAPAEQPTVEIAPAEQPAAKLALASMPAAELAPAVLPAAEITDNVAPDQVAFTPVSPSAAQRYIDIDTALRPSPAPTYRDWATQFATALVLFDGRDLPDDFDYELLVRKLISWASGEEPCLVAARITTR